MTSTFKFLGFGASFALATLLAGCSTGSDNSADTGGTSSTGGTSGGGVSNKGGSTSAGGASGSTKLWGFDSDFDAFKLSNVANSTMQYINLGDAAHAATAKPTLAFAAGKDFGSVATSGSMKVTADFSFWNQSIGVEIGAPSTASGAPIDFTNMTVSAQISLAEGLSPFTTGDAPGGVVFYMKSGSSYAWGQAPWTNLTSYGGWTKVKFNTANPDSGSAAEFDPSNVVQIGFQFSSGGGGTHCPDASNTTFTGTPSTTCPAWDTTPLPTTIYIDDILLTPNP